MNMQAGWLDDVTNWLREALLELWQGVVEFFKDLILLWLESLLNTVALAIESLPVPDLLTEGSLGQYLGQAGPVVGWAMSNFRLGEGLGLIAMGYGFRLIRKFATLFQW